METSDIQKPSAFSIGLKYGAILFLVSAATFVVKLLIGVHPLQDTPDKWATMVLSLIILVFAHNEFKKNGDGYMSYGEGFLVTFIASIVSFVAYSAFVLVYAFLIDAEFMNKFYDVLRQQMEEKGQGEQADIAIEWTKKLFWPFFVGIGIFVSVFFALIMPLFTKKNRPVSF